MRIPSKLTPEAYLSAIKERMGSHFSFGAERYTGFFAGRLFFVTHHAGYNWNERYTNQKNGALCYIKPTNSGCEVRFVRFKGLLCPPQFLFLFLLYYIPTFLIVLLIGIHSIAVHGMIALLILGVSLFAALIETFFESLTENSEFGRKYLIAFLLDPTDPFSYLNHKNEIY
jgi:hypothetical protein